MIAGDRSHKRRARRVPKNTRIYMKLKCTPAVPTPFVESDSDFSVPPKIAATRNLVLCGPYRRRSRCCCVSAADIWLHNLAHNVRMHVPWRVSVCLYVCVCVWQAGKYAYPTTTSARARKRRSHQRARARVRARSSGARPIM